MVREGNVVTPEVTEWQENERLRHAVEVWTGDGEWGVMFNDGSVMHRWNGRTQKMRALEEVAECNRLYPRDRITLAWRADRDAPWERR